MKIVSLCVRIIVKDMQRLFNIYERKCVLCRAFLVHKASHVKKFQTLDNYSSL